MRAEGPIAEPLGHTVLVRDVCLDESLGGEAVAVKDFHGIPATKEVLPVGVGQASPLIVALGSVPMAVVKPRMGGNDDGGFPFFAISKKGVKSEAASHGVAEKNVSVFCGVRDSLTGIQK